VFNVFKLFFF